MSDGVTCNTVHPCGRGKGARPVNLYDIIYQCHVSLSMYIYSDICNVQVCDITCHVPSAHVHMYTHMQCTCAKCMYAICIRVYMYMCTDVISQSIWE